MVLPSQLRLKGYKSFNHLYKKGFRYHGASMILRVAVAKPNLLKRNSKKLENFKCAVSISHKVSKKSVIRNKLRRIFHAHLTLKLKHLKSQSWALLSLKPESSSKKTELLLKECDHLLSKAGLMK